MIGLAPHPVHTPDEADGHGSRLPDETVGSLKSHRRTAATVGSTLVMTSVLVAGPVVLGWWAIRSFERSGYLFVDLVFAVAIASSLIAWMRVFRPEAAVKRIVVVPVSIQRSGRYLFERSSFGVGAMKSWTSVEPEVGLTFVRSARTRCEVEWENEWLANRVTSAHAASGATPVSAAAVDPQKGAAMAPRPLPDSVVVRVLARGESFWSLAEETLGDGKRWAELRELNVGREVAIGVVLSDTDSLNAGYRILVPVTERGVQSNAES